MAKQPFLLDPESRLPFARYQYVNVTFATANVDVDIPHNLRFPNLENPELIRYVVDRQSAPGVIYQDMSPDRRPWEFTHIFLRSSVPTVARILLYLEVETEEQEPIDFIPNVDPLPTGPACGNFERIRVPDAEDVIADDPCDVLNLVPGTGIVIETDPANDEITISSTCCGDEDFCGTLCNVYAQNWAAGEGDEGFNFAAYESSTYGGPDPPDTIYPELRASEAVTVVTGTGPNGENALDSDGGAGATVVTGSFTKATATGNQAVTGLGIRPKALILFTTRQTVEGYTDTVDLAFGFTDGARQACRMVWVDDGTLTMSNASTQSDSHLIRLINDTSVEAVGDIVSFDVDGFTINWTTNDGLASQVHYIGIAGNVNARVGTFTRPTTAASQDVTGVGFTPTFVMFMPGRDDPLTASDATTTGAAFHIGAANASQQWANAFGTGPDNANTAQTWQRTDRCILAYGNNGAENSNATFTAFLSDGFRILWNACDNTNVATEYYLALNNIDSALGALNAPTSNGSQAITGFGFEPEAVFLTSGNKVAGNNTTDHGRYSIGYAGTNSGGAREGCVWIGTEHGEALNYPSARRTVTTKCISTGEETETGSSSTTTSEADMTSLDADGFTLGWTTTDATSRQVLYLGLSAVGSGLTDYAAAGVWLQMEQTWDGSAGCVTLNYNPNNAAWTELTGLTVPLFTLIDSLFGDALSLNLNIDVVDEPEMMVTYRSWNGGSPTVINATHNAQNLGRAATLNEWQEIKFMWQAGTDVFGASGLASVASDGFFRVFSRSLEGFDREERLIMEDSGIDLYVDSTSNRLSGIQIGYPGLWGQMTNLVIKGPCGGTFDPDNVAPIDAEYIVGSASATLTNERVATDTATIDVNLGTPGQAKWDVFDDSITYAKMQNISAASRLLGRGSAAGAGDPQEITLGTGLTMSGTTLNASTASWIPLVTGAEPPVFVTDGAGHLILVAYP